MKQRQYISWVLIVVTVGIALLKSCITTSKYFFWGYNCSFSLLLVLDILALLGSIGAIVFSQDKVSKIVGWILILFFLINLYFIFSFNNLQLF